MCKISIGYYSNYYNKERKMELMITTYMANKIQNYIFRGESFTPPTTYYIALSKTAPNVDGTGVTEPTNSEYERISVAKNTSNFSASVDGLVKNSVALLSVDTISDWGTISHYGVYDSATGGNLLFFGELSNSRHIDVDMQLVINVGGLVFELTNA